LRLQNFVGHFGGLNKRTTGLEQLPQRTSAAAGDASAGQPGKSGFLGIPGQTWNKIIPLGMMFFCILFNYTILRDTKVCSLTTMYTVLVI
jgi:ATP:ADP antiporter, AAA family